MALPKLWFRTRSCPASQHEGLLPGSSPPLTLVFQLHLSREHLSQPAASLDNQFLRSCLLILGDEAGTRSSLKIEVVAMLWTIFAILIILWLLGWGFHIAGSLIHLLLVIALVVAVINLVSGRRAV